MESIEFERACARARAKYEWVRLRGAVVGLTPVLAIVALAARFGSRPGLAWTLGACVFSVGVALLWYGRDLRRAVLPGIVAGVVPLGLALCASHIGHVCTGSGCMGLCVPACTAGGLVAGLAVAAIGRRRAHGAGYWIAASSLALLTGAMGCTCIGYSGLIGLAVGYGAALVPMAAHRWCPR